jgi:uncharacterized protein YdhG (YjbR/CyaY superfamily)
MDDEVKKYIANQPSPQKRILERLRQLIRKTAPLAKEGMSYSVPAFKLKCILRIN